MIGPRHEPFYARPIVVAIAASNEAIMCSLICGAFSAAIFTSHVTTHVFNGHSRSRPRGCHCSGIPEGLQTLQIESSRRWPSSASKDREGQIGFRAPHQGHRWVRATSIVLSSLSFSLISLPVMSLVQSSAFDFTTFLPTITSNLDLGLILI
jgi:hypothetical protein